MDRYIVDVYVDKRPFFLRKYEPVKRKGRSLNYWRIHFETENDAGKLIRKLERREYRYKAYEEKYARNGSYRDVFIRNTQPPYRCRYCNCRLEEEDLIVDHIVPVGKANVSKKAQRILHRRGIPNVNHIDNLAATCTECNENKGNQMGVWTQKGFMGYWKWHAYRLLLELIRIGVISFVAIMLYRYFEMMH